MKIMTEQPKYIVLENDHKLGARLSRFLKDKQYTALFMASVKQSEEISEEFAKSEILIFEPTQIFFSQYNLMMMIIYDLIVKKTLCISQIHIFTHDEDITKTLQDLWEGKRMYLDKVLPEVRIFRIDPSDFDKTEIFL